MSNMTSRFLEAIHYILEHEGGYNNIKEDSGGATNWGISLVLLRSLGEDIDGDGDIDWIDIKKLTQDHAISIYWNNFWRSFYDTIPERLAIKIFDTAVNTGSRQAHRILQKSINRLITSTIVVDGLIGQTTLKYLDDLSEDSLLKAFCKEQENYYKEIIKKKPEKIKFINGWIKRANWLPK